MNVQTTDMARNVNRRISVRDVIVAKAIQNGYNPFCKSTDANARRVTDEMRARVRNVVVPENKALATAKKSAVREATVPAVRKQQTHARREIVHIENFELVRRKTPSLSLGMLVSVLITAMVLAMVVYSGSLINKEARRYSELSESLEVLKEEDKTLTLALENKHEAIDIADIAVNEYGMVAARAATTDYLSLSDGNSVEVYSADSEDASVPVDLLNTFGDKIGGFLEYLD